MTPEIGDAVVCTALDRHPRMLVVGTDGDTVRAVLLARLAMPTIQRLATAGDAPARRRTIATAVDRADGIEVHELPASAVVPATVLADMDGGRP